MPLLDLSFEWLVDDAGYSVMDYEPKNKPKPFKNRRGVWVSIASNDRLIVREGGNLRTTRPLDFHRTLFVEFARLDGTEESCVRFANSYGFLGLFPDEMPKNRRPPDGEYIILWRDAILVMRQAVDAWQAKPGTFASDQELIITQLDASLVPIDGRPQLRILPRSLIGAIRLQFAQAVSTGLDIRNCDHCGKLFEIGGGGRTRKARFCSDRCRTDYHVARRKQP